MRSGGHSQRLIPPIFIHFLFSRISSIFKTSLCPYCLEGLYFEVVLIVILSSVFKSFQFIGQLYQVVRGNRFYSHVL